MTLSIDSFERKRLFGLDFVDASSVEEVAGALLAAEPAAVGQHSRILPLVVTPNVDQLVKRARRTDDVAVELVERAQFVLADGQPIVWASRLVGQRLSTRLAGSSLIESLWPQLVTSRRRVLVVAGSAFTAECVREEGPTTTALTAPMLDLHRPTEFDEFATTCADAALRSGAEFVFVTLGFPKQCNIIDRMVRQWPPGQHLPIFLAVGASLDMYYGEVRRAPQFIQRAGLEWLFRFVQEPRRLFRRYFVDGLAFGPMVISEWKAQRARSGAEPPDRS